MIKILFLKVIFIFGFTAQLTAQDVKGTWVGYMKHTSCEGSRKDFGVKLEIKKEAEGYKCLLNFYPYGVNLDDSSIMTIWSFNADIDVNETTISINFKRNNEVFGRIRNYGNYLTGQYFVSLKYLYAENEKLNGKMNSRSYIVLTKKNGKRNNSYNSNLFAQLRAKQQEKKANAEKNVQKTETTNVSLSKESLSNRDTNSFTLKANEEQTVAAEKKQEQLSLEKSIKRTTNLIDSIVVKDSGYIDVAIFDNGVIDNDTISLYNDNNLVLYKIRINAKPIKLRIYKSDNLNKSFIKMIAENLGDIPPNTAYIKIEWGYNVKEFYLKSDYNSNSTLLIKWE